MNTIKFDASSRAITLVTTQKIVFGYILMPWYWKRCWWRFSFFNTVVFPIFLLFFTTMSWILDFYICIAGGCWCVLFHVSMHLQFSSLVVLILLLVFRTSLVMVGLHSVFLLTSIHTLSSVCCFSFPCCSVCLHTKNLFWRLLPACLW